MPPQTEVTPAEVEPKKTFVRLRAHKERKLPNGKPSKRPEKIEIKNGDYKRTFHAADEPFEVKSEDELNLLKSTGLFVEDKQAEKADADAEQASDSSPAATAAAGKKKAGSKESKS